jgi:hypothetical protein
VHICTKYRTLWVQITGWSKSRCSIQVCINLHFCIQLHICSNFWHLIVAQIFCSLVIEKRKIKNNHAAMKMRNEKNSK